MRQYRSKLNQNNLNDEFDAEIKSIQEIKPIESKRNKINLAKNSENSIESCSVGSDSDSGSDSNNNNDNDILDDDIQIGVNNVDNDEDTFDEVI
jgi:hypothetical protein